MLAGTGLPPNVSELINSTLTGPPILVEMVSITEIGHSAFSLHNVRQARIERADLAGLAEQEEDGEEEGSIPNYPRSMLKFELSDGSTTMQAIEYRRLPGLQLGETPLGLKVRRQFAIGYLRMYCDY
jgi:RecQ-mediated genome instability protein 1